MGPLHVEHRYQTCRDPDRQRFACHMYREGYDNGFADAMAASQAQAREG